MFGVPKSSCQRRRLRHGRDHATIRQAKPVVWRWQARFMAEGVAGLTRDKLRKPGKPPLPVVTVRRVVDLADSRHVEHSHAQILWFRREPWRRPQNSFRCERPLLPQPVH
jgi:hypothetical protein